MHFVFAAGIQSTCFANIAVLVKTVLTYFELGICSEIFLFATHPL